MNIADTISIYAGGPGSGCHGPNCGRIGESADEKSHSGLLHNLVTKHGFQLDSNNGKEATYSKKTDKGEHQFRMKAVGASTFGHSPIKWTYTPAKGDAASGRGPARKSIEDQFRLKGAI